ncbi:FMN-dependent dehydrogenase-domain-containing protein [Amylostereum chailletii]|nr:FMN-dependent dehydrogenase-domain-containing protein [Amylostereum chailletii]
MPASSADVPQSPSVIPYAELSKHTTRDSLWILIDDTVYDVTELLESHPGGTGPLLKYAGKDATTAFAPIHPPGTLDTLPVKAVLGKVDKTTAPTTKERPTEEELRMQKARHALPSPGAVLNLREIEQLAEGVLSATAWGYYRSAGDDELTFDENRAAFTRFWFRPRLFGHPSSLPIFICPAALARLGHPDGEMNMVRAAGKAGILQGVSNNASCSTAEIMSAKLPGQPLLFQLYVNRDRPATEKLLAELKDVGYSGIMLTVDAAVPGKRERDQRAKGDFVGTSSTGSGVGGVAHAISGYQDPDVCWEDIPWIRRFTDLPLIVKGIQCVEDAEIALDKYHVDGIILSNHGGRELDFAPAAVTVLYELHLQRPDLLRKHEVYIDGGVTRGTDVLKALCLGARGVGLGRAFLYGNALWGEEGCQRVIEIMREEILTGMRLMGVTRLEQLGPGLVRHVGEVGRARL